MVRVIDRGALDSPRQLAVGGQGIVYETPKLGIFNRPAVFKEYKPEYRVDLNPHSLGSMIDFLENQTFARGSRIIENAAWPMALVEDRGDVCGFLMARIPDEFYIDLQAPSGRVDRRDAQFQHVLNSEDTLARRNIAMSNRDRFDLLANAAETLAFFHSNEIAVGDLSPKNLLFSLGPSRACYFVDCDAMVINGQSALPQAETPDWGVEVVTGEPLGTKQSDMFKFALLVLRLFAGDQSTFNVRDVPKTVSSGVRALIEQALDVDPGSRLPAERWIAPLRAASGTASTRAPQRRPSSLSGPATPSSQFSPRLVPAPPATRTRLPISPHPSAKPRRGRRLVTAVVVLATAIGIPLAVTHRAKPVSPATMAASGTLLPSAATPAAVSRAKLVGVNSPAKARLVTSRGGQLWWWDSAVNHFVSENSLTAPPHSPLYANPRYLRSS